MKGKRKVEAKGQYWGEEQDKAVRDYNIETDQRKRSQLFATHLYEHLHAMASTILGRYYKKHDEELVLDSISHVVEKAFPRFDIASGKSYSFFQRVIKNYYYDALNPRTKKFIFVPIDDFNFEHNGDNSIVPKQLIIDDQDLLEDQRNTVIVALEKERLKKYLTQTHNDLIDAILDLIERREGFSREYVTLFLMIRAKTHIQYTLKNYLDQLGIKLSITNIDRINAILCTHAIENGIVFDGKHDLKTIEHWQSHALNHAVKNKKYVFESI